MAISNVNPPRKLTEASVGTARDFDASDAALIIQHVTAARAVLRTVALAVNAQIDGSVEYDNNKTERWQPAIDAACTKLEAVRDVLIKTRSAPGVDWWTPLALMEAIGAALWHGNGLSQGERLEDVELATVAQVAIDSLDALMGDYERVGVCKMVSLKGAADLH